MRNVPFRGLCPFTVVSVGRLIVTLCRSVGLRLVVLLFRGRRCTLVSSGGVRWLKCRA